MGDWVVARSADPTTPVLLHYRIAGNFRNDDRLYFRRDRRTVEGVAGVFVWVRVPVAVHW